jgi:hypothetical protein
MEVLAGNKTVQEALSEWETQGNAMLLMTKEELQNQNK